MDIMIISNNEGNLNYLSDMLIKSIKGAQIYCFIDSMMAIKYMAHNSIDMIFTEAEMKFIDVIQFTKLARKFNPDVDVSILSENRKHRALSIIAEADRFIEKPISSEIVEEVVHSYKAVS